MRRWHLEGHLTGPQRLALVAPSLGPRYVAAGLVCDCDHIVERGVEMATAHVECDPGRALHPWPLGDLRHYDVSAGDFCVAPEDDCDDCGAAPTSAPDDA